MVRAPLGGARRIVVVGGGGAGKSTVARRLGALLDVPVVHMDAEFWLPGWRQPSAKEWEARVEVLVAGEAWVIDGSHGESLARVLARAQLAVFLDVGRVRAVLRLVRRRLRGARPDLPLPARLPLAFVWETWRYHDRLRPGLVAQLQASGVPWVRLRTPAEVAEWLRGAGAGP